MQLDALEKMSDDQLRPDTETTHTLFLVCVSAFLLVN